MKKESFEGKVLDTIKKYRMVEKGDKVLVAVSGGPDSVALLNFLYLNRNDLQIELGVFHLNHLLRGEESKEDARFVKDISYSYQLPAHLYSVDIKKVAQKNSISLEEAGRLARYKLLYRTKQKHEYTKIALAHHRDDEIETFLLRLIKGASLEGLSAIPPTRDEIIRPFIEVDKKDILSYLDALGKEYKVDVTNLSDENLRAKIRNKIVPVIKEINPGFNRVLASNLEALKEDAEFLKKYSEDKFKQYVKEREGILIIPTNIRDELSAAIVKRMLLLAVFRIKGDLKGVKRTHIDTLFEGLLRDTGFEFYLPGKNLAVTEYGNMLIAYKYRLLREEIEEFTLRVPGEAEIKPTPFVMRASKIPVGEVEFLESDYTCHLDAKKLGEKITVRSWKRGDRIKPLGMEGTKKIHDIFVDRKIPRRLRKQTPLVIAEDGDVAWVAGIKVSQDYALDKNTKDVVKLEISRKRKIYE